MSWVALGWASKQKPGRVADKMVLIALADRHNEESDVSYPSVAWLADFSCLDRKTVVAALNRLESAGLISDSGQRVGKTKQVKAYSLAINDTEKGMPKAEPLPPKDTAFSAKQSQKRDTEPSREPSPKKDKPSLGKPTLVPDDFRPIMSGITLATVDGWPPGRQEEEVEHFIDHHTAKGTLSKDWQASWRTWVKFSKKWEPKDGQSNRGNNRNGRSASGMGRTIDAAQRFVARHGPN